MQAYHRPERLCATNESYRILLYRRRRTRGQGGGWLVAGAGWRMGVTTGEAALAS